MVHENRKDIKVNIAWKSMEDKTRCQSCGMPLDYFQGKDNFGTNVDGTKSDEYCSMCFRDGRFAEPSLTVNDMLNKSVNHMVKALKFTRERAKELSFEVIPKLKRGCN